MIQRDQIPNPRERDAILPNDGRDGRQGARQEALQTTIERVGKDGRAAKKHAQRRYERRQVMAVYKPKRKGKASKFYICEFVYQGKRFQESTGATSKTVAKEYEKRRKAEMERAAAGLPTEKKATRIRNVAEVTKSVSQRLQVNSPAFQRRFCHFAFGRCRSPSR